MLAQKMVHEKFTWSSKTKNRITEGTDRKFRVPFLGHHVEVYKILTCLQT